MVDQEVVVEAEAEVVAHAGVAEAVVVAGLEVQADPEDAQIPSSSIIRRIASPSTNSKLMLVVLGSLFEGAPLILLFGMRARSSASSLSLMDLTLVFSSSMRRRASSHATPSPMMLALFSVPPRRPFS